MAKRIDIKGKIAGDDLRVKATVTGIPAGETIVKAWLTIKKAKSLADAALAWSKKVVNSGFVHTGTNPVTCEFNIELAAADTAQLQPQTTLYYDIQVKTASGVIDTPIEGQIIFDQGVTHATS